MNETNATTADDSTPADIGWAEPIAEPTRPECAPETIFSGCGSDWVSAAVLPRYDVRWSITGGHITLVASTLSGRTIAALAQLREPICDGNGCYRNPDGLRFHDGEEAWVAAHDAAIEYVRTLIACAYDFWAVGVWLSYQTPRREFAGYLASLHSWGTRGVYIPPKWRELSGRAPGTLRPADLLEA